jgi:hypothetical protein
VSQGFLGPRRLRMCHTFTLASKWASFSNRKRLTDDDPQARSRYRDPGSQVEKSQGVLARPQE